ncbi:MAG: hypothetical protein C4527_03635 [Candidatus Omnitrophota bacterium]|jgi:hypothetical protein|nr:MAG: hypothetical protein C4527_03635 [Candidatus Omnitrophota bacterium]
MELILDSRRIDVIETSDTPLRKVIERVSDILKDQNRVISEILVDGVMIGGWDDPSIASRNVGECISLRLSSDEPRRIAHRVLYDIADYLPKIQKALVETSVLLQSRKETEGLELLEKVTATWAELYHGLQSAVTVTGLDLNMVSVKGQTFLQLNHTVHDYLEEVTGLIQDQQFLELSDILEYEIAPRMPDIQEGIYLFIKELEKKTH